MSIDKKKDIIKNQIIDDHGCRGSSCSRCARISSLIDKMEESNIPAGYWLLSMKHFSGSNLLKDIVDSYILKIKENYKNGVSVCFSGNQGTGKTMSSICILKAALKNEFSAYYITASDMLSDLTNYNSNYDLRKKLKESDFLVIDELDSRFFVSDSVKELFSGLYENIFRYRTHNLFPTIICTNETSGILNVFRGAGVQSIHSLNTQYLKMYPVAGLDYRKTISEVNNG